MLRNLFKAVEPGGRLDYGLDGPGVIRNLLLGGLTSLLFSLLGTVRGSRTGLRRVGFGLGLLMLGLAGAMLDYSKRVKFKQRDRILDLADLKAGDRVLDVGSGRGLLAIGAARRLAKIKVTALDIWKPGDLSANSEEALRSNIDLEDLAPKIRVEEADARALPFADAAFEVIVSNLCLHNVGQGEKGRLGRAARQYEKDQRREALAEITRVLAPGGRAILSDMVQLTDEYCQALQHAGLKTELHRPLLCFLTAFRHRSSHQKFVYCHW